MAHREKFCVSCDKTSFMQLPKVCFYSFPKDSERKKLWLQALAIDTLPTNRRGTPTVCSLHFTRPTDFKGERPTILLGTSKWVPILSKEAVPSVAPISIPVSVCNSFHQTDNGVVGTSTKYVRSVYACYITLSPLLLFYFL